MVGHTKNRRSSSGSTVRPVVSNPKSGGTSVTREKPFHASLWIHDESFSSEQVLLSKTLLTDHGVDEGTLLQVSRCEDDIETADFADRIDGTAGATFKVLETEPSQPTSFQSQNSYLCVARSAPPELASKHLGLEISISKAVAAIFSFAPRTRVVLSPAHFDDCTASHVEVCFRDAYLSRSDMWRFTCQELVGKTIYVGQRITFIGGMRATIKNIHVNNRRSPTAYFSADTVPVFRSEAARYIIFIQMSRGMWDFDSEGSGEILFNRVVNGFLPDLFKRWSELEVRHLVSIIMFGRMEYDRHDMFNDKLAGLTPQSSLNSELLPQHYQDFYRVVVTDMASAQWTIILDELKKDFRVFLRDVSLFSAPAPKIDDSVLEEPGSAPTRITGRLSAALKGNILEAINLAASQFSDDYIDRDLIRTGVSTVIVTPGTGVFDVDRDLLRLTSETLTNNGIGIDIVCLSKMPLHSVPLFRYRLPESDTQGASAKSKSFGSPNALSSSLNRGSLPNLSHSPAFSSMTSNSTNYFAKFPAAFPSAVTRMYGYGIPHWIDLSYWSPETRKLHRVKQDKTSRRALRTKTFVPRVRMYELQMMGIMELGMADIAIPYLAEIDNVGAAKPRAFVSGSSSAQYGRSLSQSPVKARKGPSPLAKFGDDKRSTPTKPEISKLFREMDLYDDGLFQFPDGGFKKPKKSSAPKSSKQSPEKKNDTPSKSPKSVEISKASSVRGQKTGSYSSVSVIKDDTSETGSIIANSKKKPKMPRISRNVSYALRGLAPLKPTAATTEVNVENVNAHMPAQTVPPLEAEILSSTSNKKLERPPASGRLQTPQSAAEHNEKSPEPEVEKPSDPIRIGTPIMFGDSGSPTTRRALFNQHDKSLNDDRNARDNGSLSSDTAIHEVSDTLGSVSTSVPKSRIPFVRNVNASNPLKVHRRHRSFGRWQHLYPRKPQASIVKWRSLCTPASIPLTHSDFPSKEDLETGYDTLTYTVNLNQRDDLQENPDDAVNLLLMEMISLRLSHGYQFVVGSNVKNFAGDHLCDAHALFNPIELNKRGSVLFFSMGDTIQRLAFPDSNQVEVTKFLKKPLKLDETPSRTHNHTPFIRTILSQQYKLREVLFRGVSPDYPWEDADHYLLENGHSSHHTVKHLRFWRARFVLLPVEPPPTTWRLHQAEENEEEIHLLGIRALTQLWQRYKYIPPSERKTAQSRMGSFRKNDQNPLEIKLETLNPSELVATELDRLLQLEEAGEVHSTQLLPEPDKLDRESSIAKFAQALQSDRGIEIKNRRWHLRLYYNCFHGEELTNWLMHNVKSMETREDAVKFGNELMKEGLFEHVNGRHNFKDGHYFFSMKPDFRGPRLDTKSSWFPTSRQSNRSIPPTPITEQPQSSPLTGRTRSGSSLAQQLNSATSFEGAKPFIDKKRKVVSLSRVIRVDVDTRKKAFFGRPEIVNVHYDRLHNPENCYHIELNWLSTTCKLVDEAVISWTNTADKYGLKLVEVPIAEACEVPQSEPFRSPFRIKLCVDPPKRGYSLGGSAHPTSAGSQMSFNNVYFTATSFGPQQNQAGLGDKHMYHKALLKKFNFVLDMEATSEFPDNVDIQYSWGKLDYKYTQFVHRSGVILAQITDEGEFLLLANRLYNSRLATTTMKDTTGKGETGGRRDVGPQSHRPPVPPSSASIMNNMQASGIVGLNLASPSTAPLTVAHFNSSPFASPRVRPFTPSGAQALNTTNLNHGLSSPFTSNPTPVAAVADSFGTRSALISSGFYNTYITPEVIKDDLEAFCNSRGLLELFYREVAAQPPPQATGSRKAGSTSSSLLKPVREVSGSIDIGGIPAFELPEAITSAAMMRRATVAHINPGDFYGSDEFRPRHGSGSTIGPGDLENTPAKTSRQGSGGGGGGGITSSPLRKGTS